MKRILGKVRQSLLNSGIALTENDRSLASIEGRHEGEKAVVIGMGPSLKTTDLERFGGFTTFACNKIYLAFDQTAWRPAYYSVCDELVAKNNQEAIQTADFGATEMFHSKVVKPYFQEDLNCRYYGYRGDLQQWDGSSDTQLPSSLRGAVIGGGYSVLLDQVQLAYVMGFSEVYVVGADFSFLVSKRTGENSRSGEVLESAGEVNHFHKDYRKPGETWTMPKMEEQRLAFDYCGRAYAAAGKNLINASRSTKLDVLERVDFDAAFPEM